MDWIKRVLTHSPKQPRPPNGLRIYAVGDVHGHSDLLAGVFAKIDADLRKNPVEKSLLVMVGDYIDRGPDSRGTIDLLLARSKIQQSIFLKGNHETFVMGFRKDPSVMTYWQKFGGLDTMRSYGLDAAPDMSPRELQNLSDAWGSCLPEAHVNFFAHLSLSFTCGDYFFAHAGVKPGISLRRQVERDLIWIRDEFLTSEKWFGKLVVHGHTPVPEPDIRPNRINIDTGAYATGKLTCLVLSGPEKRFL